MYNPRHFREERIPVLQELIRRQSLATLVTLGAEGLNASHIPLLLDPEPEPLGTLRGHLSRANSQWREFSKDVDALVIFAGPQHYISPNWYPSKGDDGKVVPTWNYAVVHAHGPLRVIDDADWLRAFVSRLTDTHEAASPEPWAVADAPEDFIAAQVKGIVGIEIPIRRLEGKWKINQNRTERDRVGVVGALEKLGDEESLAMAELVKRTL